ncbi:MAG: hypothetical protein WAM14_22565 [Candidatus Nitrosopolaris sp.]
MKATLCFCCQITVQIPTDDWYKNFRANQTLKISVSGEEIPARGKPITDIVRVRDVMNKFSSKYGDVRKYYPKSDVAVEVPL